jgi:SAM-dependent methyltransferase
MKARVSGYYARSLSAERLRACYELAPPRTRDYLEGEIRHVLERAPSEARILELGCGYGRILERLASPGRIVIGIDHALPNLALARKVLGGEDGARLAAMDAVRLGFRGGSFDLTLCLQNGISAFAVDPALLLQESVRVTRSGGLVLFSTYAAGFWNDRLEWFEVQAAHGLIGAIDHEATRDGTIICRDGFRATTMTPEGFRALAAGLKLPSKILEVQGSSLFCEILVP